MRGTLSPMTRSPSLESIRHMRPPQPLRFPESQPEWDLGQSIRHLQLCVLLHEILSAAVGPASSVGCDQFVYFDAANPRRCLAPDGFVKLGVPQEMFETWRVWEKGAPELAIEILSPSDTREPLTWPEKMERYASAGVKELIAFDVDAAPGERLRTWDRLDDELVPRVVTGERTPCLTLGGTFVLAPLHEQPVALRYARDASGVDLVPTAKEELLRVQASRVEEEVALHEERAGREHERAGREQERLEKEAALAEVARLREELGRR